MSDLVQTDVQPAGMPSGHLGSERSDAEKTILRLHREIKGLRLQIAELAEGRDEALCLARLRADADIEAMGRAQLIQKIAALEAKYRFADLDGEITGYLRMAAKETFAGNCGFADDDLRVLTFCARWALANGIPDDLCPNIFPKAKAALRGPLAQRQPDTIQETQE